MTGTFKTPFAFETIKVELVEDHLLLVTFDRPEAGNSTNTQMGRELLELWTGLYIDQQKVRCVVLTGAGEKIFNAGGDLKERNNMTDEQWQQQHALFEKCRVALLDCPVPVIAAVNGAAFGGGLETVVTCDFAYAARRARFALTEIKLGIIPGGMGTQNLPRAVGIRRAKEIILTGKPFSAEEACDWGVVNKVCDDDKLMEEVLETARTICNNAPLAIYQAKKSMNVATQVDLKNGYAFEIEAYNRLVTTEDRLEGVRAFNEKRKANFKGK
ncbi:enoyl-CoA hydratase-related protein [Hyphomonas adhaerens]|jgi:enoyl-CoA hydratase/carnithine racemase|uniref:enoyl-CoA hydratase-related protein n=1 Tax=Hyphomonas adhaerens TaxID=81029 RepID=UPI003B599CAC|tara:strand:- start:221 stop:1033 length:813 start_codon:yes stop_codon:yes gene_type:complete